jgi:exodeoxyribonuclease V alpha subunit
MEFHEDGGSSFTRNLQNPLEEDVIIVDETSMVDCMLMSSLLSAMKNSARLILIGDADQLPSVGGGNVLGDIIESGAFSVVCLDEIFRQAKESLIITNAHEINNGNMPVLDKKDGDFFFLESDNETVSANTVVSLIETRLPRAYGVSSVNDIQILSPTKKGTLGTVNLNYILQNKLNPANGKKKEYAHGANIFREGDKVMQVRNNYDIEWNDVETYEDGNGVFNGDVGVIEKIYTSDGYMTVIFDKRRCDYDFSFLDDLSPAYAITVHKSQGSEYPFVIIPLANATKMLLTRNLLYTAVTRAKRMVILVGSKKNVAMMVENNTHARRYTCLKNMLKEAEV